MWVSALARALKRALRSARQRAGPVGWYVPLYSGDEIGHFLGYRRRPVRFCSLMVLSQFDCARGLPPIKIGEL